MKSLITSNKVEFLVEFPNFCMTKILLLAKVHHSKVRYPSHHSMTYPLKTLWWPWTFVVTNSTLVLRLSFSRCSLGPQRIIVCKWEQENLIIYNPWRYWLMDKTDIKKRWAHLLSFIVSGGTCWSADWYCSLWKIFL